MRKRYAIGTAISVATFAVLNAIEPGSSVDDLVVPHGRPFHFWYEGGFVTHRGLFWGGLLADVFVILGTAMCFAYLIDMYERWRNN